MIVSHNLIRPNEALLAAFARKRISIKHYPARAFFFPHLHDAIKNFVHATLIPVHKQKEELSG